MNRLFVLVMSILLCTPLEAASAQQKLSTRQEYTTDLKKNGAIWLLRQIKKHTEVLNPPTLTQGRESIVGLPPKPLSLRHRVIHKNYAISAFIHGSNAFWDHSKEPFAKAIIINTKRLEEIIRTKAFWLHCPLIQEAMLFTCFKGVIPFAHLKTYETILEEPEEEEKTAGFSS